MQLSRRRVFGLLAASSLFGCDPLQCLADSIKGISQQEFARLHALLKPDSSELWRTIAWKTSLLDAQRISASERKRMFVWAMDGHPLGCT